MYQKYTTKQITESYIKQSKTVWPAIIALAQSAIADDHDLIIEGHQIHPKLISDLKKALIKIKGILIIRTNLDSIISGALKNKATNDWFIDKTKNPETYHKIALMIKAYSQYFINQNKKKKIKMIATDNNFTKQINLAVSYLKS